jgi:two-component system chemotaxis response regulator CheY
MRKNAENADVLVVEDSDTIRKIIVQIVRKVGVGTVREAIDGSTAWTAIQASKPDLILSDWHMAPVDGYKLLRRVKGEEALADIPFFMITTETDVALVEKAKRAGTAVFIHKPFTADELRLKLGNYLVFRRGVS